MACAPQGGIPTPEDGKVTPPRRIANSERRTREHNTARGRYAHCGGRPSRQIRPPRRHAYSARPPRLTRERARGFALGPSRPRTRVAAYLVAQEWHAVNAPPPGPRDTSPTAPAPRVLDFTVCLHDRAASCDDRLVGPKDNRPGWPPGESRPPRAPAHAASCLRLQARQRGHDTRAIQQYLGHRDIQHTVRTPSPPSMRRCRRCSGGSGLTTSIASRWRSRARRPSRSSHASCRPPKSRDPMMTRCARPSGSSIAAGVSIYPTPPQRRSASCSSRRHRHRSDAAEHRPQQRPRSSPRSVSRSKQRRRASPTRAPLISLIVGVRRTARGRARQSR